MHHGRPFLFVHILLLFLLQDLGFCLNKYIDRFETLNYRPVVHQHERKKRATNILGGGGDDSPTKPIDIRFRSYAHNRTFHLKLRPINTHSSIFADNHILDVDGAYYSHVLKPHHFLYEGRLEGDPKSAVYGTLLDGIFDGYITTGDGQTFTVEKASRYFGIGQRPHNYHSIVYSDAAIDHKRLRVKRGTAAVDDRIGRQWPEEEAEESSLHGCGLTKQLHQQMHRFQESAADTDEAMPASAAFTREHNNSGNHVVDLDGLSEREDFQMLLPFPDRYLNRTKRSEKPEFREIRGRRIYEVRTCTIYLQADHKLYEHIYHKEGNKDHIRTREEIVALLYTHIKAVNQIYEGTDFNGIRGINFAIKRTTIYTPQTCVPGGGERAAAAGNPFCEENVDVSNYLNMNSQKDHSAFCLAYSLTYRDFIGGTLGLAWVASPSQSTAGGICQKYQRYNEHQRGGVNRSLNTGIITLVNYGNRVPARVSQLTLAHEIGHNFGSPHDFPLECQPGLPDGNFIMFASATSGDKPNNSKFSRCSVANISEVLFEVLAQSPKGLTLGRKKNCFTDQLKSFCGNQIKEDDEQCDCGFTQQDCQEMGDQCCQPREGATDANMCRRKPGKQCSPSEGLCCDASSCSFYGRGSRTCREDSECLERQFCDGLRPDCPASRPKTNGKPCQDSTKVCHLGSCNGSLCAHHGLRDCFLTEGKPEDLCQLACEKNGLCLPSASLPELAIANLSQEGRGVGYLLLPPGSPCNNYQGYCDIFRKCRSVDSNGPLARLKNLLFNRDTIKEFTQLVKENWWACLLIGIIVLMLMALFVKCCAVHTPSTNPNKLPPANFTDTLRHPGTLLRRGHGPRPAVAQRRERPSRSGNNHHHPATSGGGANVANQQQPHGRRSSQQPPNGGGGHQPRSGRTGATANHMVAETPLIQISSSATSPPNNAVMPAEPPPPYQLTDPAAIIVVPSPPAAAVAGPSTSQQLPATPNHHRLSALLTTIPTPLPLPGAPPPASTNHNNNPVLPLIPGPPHGHGPKPGRRKPKKSPHQRGKEGAKQQQQQQLAGQPSTSAKQKEMPTPGNKEKQRQNKRQAK